MRARFQILATLAAIIGFGDSFARDQPVNHPMRDGNTRKSPIGVARDRRNRHRTGHSKARHRRRYLRPVSDARVPSRSGMFKSIRIAHAITNDGIPGSFRGTAWIQENRRRRAAGLPQHRAVTPEMVAALTAAGMLSSMP